MKFIALIVLLFLTVPRLHAQSGRGDTNDVRAWLNGAFRSWLTRSYPEINSKDYPEWFHDHPAGLQPRPFTNWLSDVFPDLETETYPTWMENRSQDALGTKIPAWWFEVLKGRFSVSPSAQPIPSIIRGPYLQLGTTNSMVVRWRTDLPTTNTVFYGSSPARMSRSARANGLFAEHAVQFTNLAPGTKYFYALGAVDTPLLV